MEFENTLIWLDGARMVRAKFVDTPLNFLRGAIDAGLVDVSGENAVAYIDMFYVYSY